MTPNADQTPSTEKREWSTPTLEVTDLVRNTRGGAFPGGSGDDGFYQS